MRHTVRKPPPQSTEIRIGEGRRACDELNRRCHEDDGRRGRGTKRRSAATVDMNIHYEALR